MTAASAGPRCCLPGCVREASGRIPGGRTSAWERPSRTATFTFGCGPTGPGRGGLLFDFPRWRELFHLPANYPRINELTEWYVVDRSAAYRVSIDAKKPHELTGEDLIEGLEVNLEDAGAVKIIVGRARE